MESPNYIVTPEEIRFNNFLYTLIITNGKTNTETSALDKIPKELSKMNTFWGKWFSCVGITPRNSTIEYYFYTSPFGDRLGLVLNSTEINVEPKLGFLGKLAYRISLSTVGDLPAYGRAGPRLLDTTSRMKSIGGVEEVRSFLQTLRENGYSVDGLFEKLDSLSDIIRNNPSPQSYDGTPALLALRTVSQLSLTLKIFLGICGSIVLVGILYIVVMFTTN